MSPDTIFAAQMWTWPDAVIKRNAQGQVLLVNSAFLSMYGGTVEAWAGNLITGWSNPPAPGNAVRFETRMSAPVDANGYPTGEFVFDWIESSAADGTSLSIARNITHVQPSPGIPVETAPAAEHAPQAQLPAAEHVQTAAPAALAAAPAFEPVMEQQPHIHAPVADTVSQTAHLVADTADAPGHAPAARVEAALPEATSSTAVQVDPVQAQAEPAEVQPTAVTTVVEEPAQAAPLVDPVAETVPQNVVAENVVAEDAPAQAQPLQAQPLQATEEREFERRALPIEDGSAVLGNNWRDAVIAKAVGATGAQAPSEASAADASAAAPAITQDGQPTRILLAEDNAINALLTRTLLEAEGCVVDTVEDGALAVEAMKVKTYDLIFMDMRMPNMDGLEATRKIRNMDHRSKGLPIIALTANAFDDDRNACFDSGMNDFMTKPVSAEELSEMVAAWTGESAKEKLARMA